ncbi:Protein of unknown function DUF1275 [Acidisarcina polymorpha]|uniref:Transmembrane protein n=1 Tax=Acidisarcina polymorpha TaxID=2211140 RepID=A0A2Z5G6G2_9BACT|nr:YoaK family protein [Acidisarcina polymorpha]AXC14136.1 Protein of unknown function DUF1275 [Acidisarcina polymorpha]
MPSPVTYVRNIARSPAIGWFTRASLSRCIHRAAEEHPSSRLQNVPASISLRFQDYAAILTNFNRSRRREPVRPYERDVLLFLLASAAGSADSWSYLGPAHAFVANMTGNTVLLGIAVFQLHGSVLPPLISLLSYALGVISASALTKQVQPGVAWARSISWTLLIEAIFMSGAEVARAVLQPSTRSVDYLLAFVAFAIGMQSGAMLQLKVPGIVTTYITGTWTTFMNGMVRFTAGRKAPHASRNYEERLLMQAGILATYFFSAVATGWLFRYVPKAAGALPSLAVFSVAIYGAVRGGGEGTQADQ